MGQCYGKVSQTQVNETATSHATTTVTEVVPADPGGQTPLQSSNGAVNYVQSVKNTPARSSSQSPWPSPYPYGVTASPLPPGVSPSPARASRGSTPRRFFRRPFPPPSPAKHIKASLLKRLGGKPKEGTIPEDPGTEPEQALDKSFGYGKNFGAKYELGKEIGRGHFGHTCSARGKKGDLKDQPLAVKIISKAKLLIDGIAVYYAFQTPHRCLFSSVQVNLAEYVFLEEGGSVIMIVILEDWKKTKMTTAISIEDVRREVKILKALSGHKHLVKFYDACEDANNVYIVM
ncbi:hypothetical protein Gohar_028297, partial [Gossypium harknessii]|nr:hypothetical protein [Gossypium harknessii]